MADLPIVKVEDVPNVLEQLEQAYWDIPFENSNFQNEAFVMAAQQTPARAYRAIGLRMFAKIRAIKEYKFSQMRNDIDRDEKMTKLQDASLTEFDRRRIELDLLQLDDNKTYSEKLLNDALRELNCLYAWFAKMPRYTREQFEAEEREHFEAKLTRALTAQGALESLTVMQVDYPEWDNRLAAKCELLGITGDSRASADL